MAEIKQLRLEWPAWVWVSLELGEPDSKLSGIEVIIQEWQGGLLRDYYKRPTEAMALRNIKYTALLWRQAGRYTELTVMHRRIVALDRAVRKHHATLSREAQYGWIAHHSSLGIQRIIDYLDHADAILSLRDMLGLSTRLDDIPESQAKRMILPEALARAG